MRKSIKISMLILTFVTVSFAQDPGWPRQKSSPAGKLVYYQKKRLGFVAFGGIGSIAQRWNEFRSDKFLPAAGAGLRFTLDKKNNINYRIDWAIGREGHTLTIGIGEAF
ncbi:MAG: hypothetical protein ND866_06600 [Pyrinomonadaceae bacterium]|nr:hypothetical protein [Pyrinomonadaceae bacterium]